ncbi:MAG: DUF1684 domain-containing protein [Terracidiphilus sp.]
MTRLASVFVLALAIFPVCEAEPQSAPAPAASVPAADDSAGWLQDLNTWRAQREHELAAPDGWLTLIGLEWLNPGLNSVGAAADNRIRIHAQAPDHIGLLTVSGATIQLLAPAGGFPPELKLNGHAAREGTLTVSDENPSTITWNGLSMVVLRRGDRFVLRVKDADSPTRTGFRGLHWYAPNANYRVTARWLPYKPTQIEKIPTVIGTTLDMTAPGVAEFLLKGKVFLLEPVIEGGDKSRLFFILNDETSKTTTYGAGRFLTTGLPDYGLAQPGSLILDFNRLYNPPCAYTPYATCPLPPQRNRLPIAIEAGEQRFTQ